MCMCMCDSGHEEIVYDSGFCPMCQLMEEIECLEQDNDILVDRVVELKEEINTLKGELQ